MTTFDLGTFTSYELGKVAESFRAEARALPHASAVAVLRRVCVDTLVYDQRYSDPWADPTFPPRFQHLRDRVAQAEPEKSPHEIEAASAADALDALVAELERLEERRDARP